MRAMTFPLSRRTGAFTAKIERPVAEQPSDKLQGNCTTGAWSQRFKDICEVAEEGGSHGCR